MRLRSLLGKFARVLSTLLLFVAMALCLVRCLPILTVMKFVTAPAGTQVVATFYANASVEIEFDHAGKRFVCHGHYDHVRVDNWLAHVPYAHARILITEPCEGDAADPFLATIAPQFSLNYSLFGHEAMMYWVQTPDPDSVSPPEVASDPEAERPETPPGPELFGAIEVNLELLRWVGMTTP
jgi:hypothetical protein